MQVPGRPAVLSVLLFVVCVTISAYGSAYPENPLDLVRQAVQNELNSSGNQNYLYEMRTDGPGVSLILVRAELADGVLTRILSLNGKQQTPEETQQWAQRTFISLSDRESMRDEVKRLREQDQKTRDLIRILPDAFLYEYAGMAGPRQVRLKFRPNPRFRPPTRESRIMQGAEGIAVIDTVDKRVVNIDATIFRSVEFAWGLIGRIYRGGRIVMEFEKANDGAWHQTALHLHVTGRMLFRKFRQDVEMRVWNHQHLPPGTTLEQAFEKLKSYPVPTANAPTRVAVR